MKFKKDYINFLFYKTLCGSNGDFKDDQLIRGIADKIISADDTGKVTFLIGKTEGLENLFKYLLYISDKIDKSQISIFNLKDNIEYDSGNLRKICKGIQDYESAKAEKNFADIPDEVHEEVRTIKIDYSEEELAVSHANLQKKELETPEEEQEEPDTGMTLIENPDDKSGEVEVFELDSISKTVENSDLIEVPETIESAAVDNGKEYEDSEDIHTEEIDLIEKEAEEQKLEVSLRTEESDIEEEVPEPIEKAGPEAEIPEPAIENKIDEETPEEEITEKTMQEPAAREEIVPEIEIEVIKPAASDSLIGSQEPAKEESVPNEAYYKFETKFFEEVKILEKLLATVDKEFKDNKLEKLSEKSLQSLTAIIEITSELSNLSRQLMFDLIADVFMTMNIYFTKVISSPAIFENEKNMLFDSSLALVNSLIKGEDYLNYDVIIDRIEKLKKQLTGAEEEEFEENAEKEIPTEEKAQVQEAEPPGPVEPEPEIKKPAGPEFDSALFKLKYLVKEFEKSFVSISSFKGEYSTLEALEKISELNNALRLIAKISSSVKENDVLKLAEVTYVFLKYLKDYRIDLLDAEIQQIVKYIIFTFKMLLTDRKPDDFNILVQHLNNPVKIFTDN